jgi:hypothetical protein
VVVQHPMSGVLNTNHIFYYIFCSGNT